MFYVLRVTSPQKNKIKMDKKLFHGSTEEVMSSEIIDGKGPRGGTHKAKCTADFEFEVGLGRGAKLR